MNTIAHASRPRRHEPLRSRMLGVTLLELMAVVLVIGVLGVIAVPSYRQYVMRAHRTEAKTALLQLQTNQERYYLANRTYGTVAQLVAANLLTAGGLSEQGTYTITIAGANATGYVATATPTDGADIDMTADAQCTTFSINAQGVRTATGSAPANCW
jgi:type IV pilus assembly protein PilE